MVLKDSVEKLKEIANEIPNKSQNGQHSFHSIPQYLLLRPLAPINELKETNQESLTIRNQKTAQLCQ
jgi:hypothetical protein